MPRTLPAGTRGSHGVDRQPMACAMTEKPTLDDYLSRVAIAEIEHVDWREGQAYFNVLREIRPDLAAVVTGSSRDPYTLDRNIGAFLEWLDGAWG